MSEKSSWASIISAVKNPIGFFVLVVLCVEALLSVAIFQVDQKSAAILAFIMAGILLLTVICVAVMSFMGQARNKESENAESKLLEKKEKLSDYEIIQNKLVEYGNNHPSKRVTVFKGDRLIKKSELATELFLLESGNLIIDDETGRPSEEKDIKYPGSIVGESCVVGANRKRTASVYVYSSAAQIVRITREEIFNLAEVDPEFKKALHYLVRLLGNRIDKVALYVGQGIGCNIEPCTVIMGDIHGFSRLSEKVTDEMACPFRFKYTDLSQRISRNYEGYFEDQGDGFKIIFRGENHASRAVTCAFELQAGYKSLIKEFSSVNEVFNEAGFGIGICSDDFTLLSKPDGTEKVLGHAIIVASAMSRWRMKTNENRIYCNPELVSQVDAQQWRFEGPLEIQFEKLDKKYALYELCGPNDSPLA